MMVSQASRGPSFETPHNNIHVIAACGREFGDAGYSGFDPLLLVPLP
jgi:hypothetical protein